MQKKKREAEYRKRFAGVIKKYGKQRHYDFDLLRFEDLFSSGHPDMCLSAFGRAFWMEAKDGWYDVNDNTLQKERMEGLSISSLNMAYYVFLYSDGVIFYHPWHGMIGEKMSYEMAAEHVFLALQLPIPKLVEKSS